MAFKPTHVPPPPLFSQIMAYHIGPKRKRKKAKLLGGGGSSKAKKLASGKKKKIEDIMHVALEGSVGDQHQHEQEFFEIHLKDLSKSQLNRLMRKIRAISISLFEHPEESSEFDEVAAFSSHVISERLRISDENILRLRKKIGRRLAQLKDVLLMSAPNRNRLCIRFGSATFTRSSFVDAYLHRFVKEYDTFVEKGVIIPDKKGLTGKKFVANEVTAFLASRGPKQPR